MLAEFGTVVDALSCAVAMQLDLAERNADAPGDRRVPFRVGVNMAARLESLAEPGGVCISDAVRTPGGRRLGFRYGDMSAQAVKNIEAPVRIKHARFRLGEEHATRSEDRGARPRPRGTLGTR